MHLRERQSKVEELRISLVAVQSPLLFNLSHSRQYQALHLRKGFTVLSHQPYLAWLNRTQACLTHLVRFVCAGVNALRYTPEVDQISGPRPGRQVGLVTLPNKLWCGLFVVRT